MQSSEQLIHLLYVPTIYCNLGCRYCYLGQQTDNNMLKKDLDRALETLKTGVKLFQSAGYIPFNISLHGGEVTTLPGPVLSNLFDFIQSYYAQHKKVLDQNGFKKAEPHIKTNLFNFDKHYDVMNTHQVSISASVDLPLALHEKYRVNKKGESTLKKTLNNLQLLAAYPHRKKLSAVIYAEHIERVEEMITDIWYLHREVGIDMNQFNFMFGFESEDNANKYNPQDNLNTQAVSDQEQVKFYRRLKSEFLGTELEAGFHQNWFDEFTPNYCTNAFNCGEKFFLLQSDGDIYSCVRGQGTEGFHYGNIFKDDIKSIMDGAATKIAGIHRTAGLHQDCKQCEYLALCHTGCPYVKYEQSHAKSYTCALQKEIYKNYPELYPVTPKEDLSRELAAYTVDMHPQLIETDLKPKATKIILPNDLYREENELEVMIRDDENLAMLYSEKAISLRVNQKEYALQSQLLKPRRDILSLCSEDEIILTFSKEFFVSTSTDTVRNTLYLQMLRDTRIVYGDEKRSKQEHTFTLEVFRCNFDEDSDCYSYSLGPVFSLFSEAFQPSVLNNLFITTGALRKYHYEKQQKNAFYHIQAINLPFQNIEFYWNFPEE